MDNILEKENPNQLRYLDPIVKQRRLWNMNYVLAALVVGFILIVIQILAMIVLSLNQTGSWILAFILLLIYACILYFLLEPKLLREVTQPILKTETTIKQVEIAKPVEIIRTIEKPIEKPVEVIKTVEKPVYIERKVFVDRPIAIKSKKLSIPKYKYVGSTLTNVYHLKTCRLAKSIKAKYRLNTNSTAIFKSKKYKPCKVCVLKIKKV